MGSNEITVTQHRGLQAFYKLMQQSTEYNTDTVQDKPEKQTEDLKIRVGEVVKFYPATDKALVKFNDGSRERCVQSHTVISDEINISWTPSGYNQWDNAYNEACIAPLSTFYAIVLSIRDSDNSKENCIIGYISKDKQQILPNANAGELKLQYYDTSITLLSDGMHLKGDNIFINDKPFSVAVGDAAESQLYTQEELTSLIDRMQEKIETLETQLNETTDIEGDVS